MMELTKKSIIIADFFLDGAKIIFGSLVVGAFVPRAVGSQLSWLSIGEGVFAAIVFLWIADTLNK